MDKETERLHKRFERFSRERFGGQYWTVDVRPFATTNGAAFVGLGVADLGELAAPFREERPVVVGTCPNHMPRCRQVATLLDNADRALSDVSISIDRKTARDPEFFERWQNAQRARIHTAEVEAALHLQVIPRRGERSEWEAKRVRLAREVKVYRSALKNEDVPNANTITCGHQRFDLRMVRKVLAAMGSTKGELTASREAFEPARLVSDKGCAVVMPLRGAP